MQIPKFLFADEGSRGVYLVHTEKPRFNARLLDSPGEDRQPMPVLDIEWIDPVDPKDPDTDALIKESLTYAATRLSEKDSG